MFTSVVSDRFDRNNLMIPADFLRPVLSSVNLIIYLVAPVRR